MTIARRPLLAGLAGVALLAACSTSSEDRSSLNSAAIAAREDLFTKVPNSRDIAARSVAYLIFPNVTEAGFLIGGQYGSGVLFRGGQPVGYYNISAGSFGLQAGAQSFSQAYFFMTEEAFRVFEENQGMEMGAGVDFVVAQTAATGERTTTMTEPVIVYIWSQAGLFGGAAVEGQKITERESE